MSGETGLTIIGHMVADAELRFTPSGHAVANFTIASTPRRFDKNAQEWVDQETLFMRCSIWRDYAEHVVESLAKGMHVIAHGRLEQRKYTTKEGEERTVYEMQVDEVGPLLRFATARVNRISKGSRQAGPATGDVPPADDPSAGTPSTGSAGAGFNDEPPFMRAPEPWERGLGYSS